MQQDPTARALQFEQPTPLAAAVSTAQVPRPRQVLTFEQAVARRQAALAAVAAPAFPSGAVASGAEIRVWDASTPGPLCTNKEIRIWDPSMTPLGATTPAFVSRQHKLEGVTTATASYPAWPTPRPPVPAEPPAFVPSPYKLDDVTTTAASYPAWPTPRRLPQPEPPAFVRSEYKFEGVTTTAASYPAWPIAPRAPPTEPLPRTPPPPFEGQTESRAQFTGQHSSPQQMRQQPTPRMTGHTAPRTPSRAPTPRCEGEAREAFCAMQLPPHLQLALGVQVAGGSFHALIPVGSQPPARGSAVFTTCLDGQTSVTIKALAHDGERILDLGNFELVGIAPAPAGLPQILVTFSVSADSLLYVTAKDKLGSSLAVYSCSCAAVGS